LRRRADRVRPKAGRARHLGLGAVPQGGYLRCRLLQLAKKYGGLGPSELRRLKQLKQENGKLMRLVVELSLDKAILPDVLSKEGLRPSRKRMLVANLTGWISTREGS